jgi:hypothetical protein
MPRYLRYLRIGWTALCGIACLVLVVLWVRSYYYSDSVAIPRTTSQRSLDIHSFVGRISVQLTAVGSPPWWKSVKRRAIFEPGRGYTVPGIGGYFDGDGRLIQPRIAIPADQAAVHVTSHPLELQSNRYLAAIRQLENRWGFGLVSDWGVIPHWFPVLLLATLATAPWLRRRFSLRTLLIATTLVAVGLGVVVYAARK